MAKTNKNTLSRKEFLNRTTGFPWVENVLGKKNVSIDSINNRVVATIVGTKNVKSVTNFTGERNNQLGRYEASFEATLVDGTTTSGSFEI